MLPALVWLNLYKQIVLIGVSSEAFEGEVPCPSTQHRDNVPRSRGEKHDNSLKILHQAGFETARQAATLAKLNTRSNHCAASTM